MTFEQFQHDARLFVLGALYPAELREFERATEKFGDRAQQCIRDCRSLRDAFRLSLRTAAARETLNHRIDSMSTRQRPV